MWVFALLLVLLIALIYFGLYFYSTRNYNYWKKRGIPYKEPQAFFGNLKDFFKLKRSYFDIIQDIYFENKKLPYQGIFLLDDPYLLIRDPELIKSIFVKDFEHFTDRSVSSNVKSDPLGGNMLFLLRNPAWKDIRRKMTPVFTSGKVKALFPITSDSSKQLVEYMKKKCDLKNEVILDSKEVMMLYTTENIVSTAFGIQANCFNNPQAEFKQVAERIFDFNNFWIAFSQACWFVAPKLVDWFKFKFIDTASANLLREAFWGAMKDRAQSGLSRNDLIDILLQMEKNKELDETHIAGQGAQFFTAGVETTSSTISFALYSLAKHKDVQDKLRQEIREANEKYGDFNYEAIQNMKYLDITLKESMRMHPVIPMLLRKCVKDYQIPGTNHVIEKGVGIIIYSLGLHRDPEYFKDPEKYIPERFLDENMQGLPQMCYLPFGEGPRNCIGMRFGLNATKSALCNILNNFEVEVCEKTHETIVAHVIGHNYAPNDNKIQLKFRKLN